MVGAFRASTDPAQWGIGGFSSGGYCAANLALRHPGEFGAAGVMDGYFRPTDGPAAAVLHDNKAAEDANNPLLHAGLLPAGAHPLPAFWLAVGTGNAADYAASRAFVHALHGVEQVDLYREPGAIHNLYAWRPALGPMLAWMWSVLAPPDLRVAFPVAGPVHGDVITPEQRPPRLAHHRRRHRPGRQASSSPSGSASTPASAR